MERPVDFIPRVYSRAGIQEILESDRNFQEFGQTAATQSRTLEDFFQDYEDLFYEIPATGSLNSHQYLVEKSSLLYKTDQILQDIQPLLDEITLLRSQSVTDQQTILDLRQQIVELNAAGS